MSKYVFLAAMILIGGTQAQAASFIAKGETSFNIEKDGATCTIERNQTKGNKVHVLYENHNTRSAHAHVIVCEN